MDRYEEFLQRIDSRFFLEPGPHSNDRGRRVLWVKYRLSANLPLKILAISEFPQFHAGPGDWLLKALHDIDWQWMIESAKASFSGRTDAREKIGLHRARRVDASASRA